MPAWLARVVYVVADALGLTDFAKALIKGVALILLLALLWLVSLPHLLLAIPLMKDNQPADFIAAAKEASQGQTFTIPWEEVAAVWAVLHEQDFDSATAAAIKSLAANWLEKHEEPQQVPQPDGTVKEETRTWYTLRDFAAVMAAFHFTAEQEDQARAYLASLQQGGLMPPPGWTSQPPPGWAWPVPGSFLITTPYGLRINPVTQQPELHEALDIAANVGAPILAAHAGVAATGSDAVSGNWVKITGGGYETAYLHLDAVLVADGARVQAGDLIGRAGNTGRSTGPHLHFAIKFLGQPQNPLQLYGGF
ncbi:MAG: M23 family metallopeptidase [Bacillota bacterium]